ncbi:MAG: serine hydrolase [Planctomycetes bacterium]|nr:serine hydrolase [Planctomycetota bacterium]
MSGRTLAEDAGPADVSSAFVRFSTPRVVFVNADTGIHAAGTMKLGVLLAPMPSAICSQSRSLAAGNDAYARNCPTAQEFDERIPRGLPPDWPLLHKTGQFTWMDHDAVLSFSPIGSFGALLSTDLTSRTPALS